MQTKEKKSAWSRAARTLCCAALTTTMWVCKSTWSGRQVSSGGNLRLSCLMQRNKLFFLRLRDIESIRESQEIIRVHCQHVQVGWERLRCKKVRRNAMVGLKFSHSEGHSFSSLTEETAEQWKHGPSRAENSMAFLESALLPVRNWRQNLILFTQDNKLFASRLYYGTRSRSSSAQCENMSKFSNHLNEFTSGGRVQISILGSSGCLLCKNDPWGWKCSIRVCNRSCLIGGQTLLLLWDKIEELVEVCDDRSSSSHHLNRKTRQSKMIFMMSMFRLVSLFDRVITFEYDYYYGTEGV